MIKGNIDNKFEAGCEMSIYIPIKAIKNRYAFKTVFYTIYSASSDCIVLFCESMAGEAIPLSKVPDGTKEEKRQRLNISLQLRLPHIARSLQRYKH